MTLNIDWNKWVNYLLPSPLRKAKMIAWMSSLIYPITLLHSDLLFFKKQVDFELEMTGQVVILQRGLNDVFDLVGRRIEIVDAEQPEAGEGVFVFVESENSPVYLSTYLTDVFSIGNDSTVDFLVCLPGSFSAQKEQIKAFVDKYKLASKRWKFHWTSSPQQPASTGVTIAVT